MPATITLRNYLSIANLQTKAAITVNNTAEALRQLDRAEEAIDDYVGTQIRNVQNEFRGQVTTAVGKVISDTHNTSQLHIIDDYFSNCVIEILGGTGKGQSRFIESSSLDGYSVTVTDSWDTQPDSTSFFRIYQLAKFPRIEDQNIQPDGLKYFKYIPQAVQNAVAAQMEYQIAQGNQFFEGDDASLKSESIGNYSYSTGTGDQSAAVALVSPRVKALLRGIKYSGGELIPEQTTEVY